MQEKREKGKIGIPKRLTIVALIGIFTLSVFMMAEGGRDVELTRMTPANPFTDTYSYPFNGRLFNDYGLFKAEVSDSDFANAEVSFRIFFNQTDDLRIWLGFERGTEASDDALDVSKRTGLTQITEIQEVQALERNQQGLNGGRLFELHKTENITRKVQIEANTTENRIRTIKLAGIEGRWKLRDLGYDPDSLQATTNELRWFLGIENGVADPWANESVEIPDDFVGSFGWVDSFNITVGDVIYRSLSHPVFGIGCTEMIYTDIAARAGEILSQQGKWYSIREDGMSLAWNWHVSGTPIRGVAGLIGVGHFKHRSDLEYPVPDTEHLKDTLLASQLWEVYWVTTESSGGNHFDDDNMIYFLDVLVDNEVGRTGVDHCLWWINSHGQGDFLLADAGVLSYYSKKRDPYLLKGWNNVLQSAELGQQMIKITGDDVYLFFWLATCQGPDITDYLRDSWFHRYHLVMWYQEPGHGSRMGVGKELYGFDKHLRYGHKSVAQMYSKSGSPWYTYYFDGQFRDVYTIEYSAEHMYDDPADMWQYRKTNGYSFYIWP